MPLTWKLNGQTLANLGLELCSGSLRTHGVSTMKLRRISNFDAGEILPYGTAVTLGWNSGAPGEVDTLFFRGKVASVPKFGSGSAEGQEIVIEDAWADLERTIYQEEWDSADGQVPMPRAVFGMSPGGAKISVGEMIAQVIDAAAADVAIAAGVDVTGETPIPSEIVNRTCDEVILDCLRLHPDWQAWMDYSTTPNPTLRVRALSDVASTSIDFAVDGSGSVTDFSVTKRDDLLPDAVRIVYETADEVDGEVYRKNHIDKWPELGPDSGPRVLQSHIPLQGANIQIQKQRIFCQTIPADNQDPDCKAYLISKYIDLKDVDPAHFDVLEFNKGLVDEGPGVDEEGVSQSFQRLEVLLATELNRELLKGSIEDWMRLKVNTMRIEPVIRANEDATEIELTKIGALSPFTITATNAPAGSKLYKGVSHAVDGDDVPTGIARKVFESIHAGGAWEGAVTVTAVDIPVYPILGHKINLTGGVTAWASMGAPIHAVDWDLDSGTATISFGPPRHLAPQDFIELQRILRSRATVWFSTDERTSDKIGAASGSSSAKGDIVGGYDFPSFGGGAVTAKGGNLDLTIHDAVEDTEGRISLLTTGRVLIFRDGAYLGDYAIGETSPYSDPANKDTAAAINFPVGS